MISIKEFEKKIKQMRVSFYKSSLERAVQAFEELGYTSKDKDYFIRNASQIIEEMRVQCWNDFLAEEKIFSAQVMEYLIGFVDYEGLDSYSAIKKYVDTFPDYIYKLCLSNTQSRRSRAGKEFEHIIDLVLMGAGVPLDSQGNIGNNQFEKKGLGKLVDTVSPGVLEYEINKRNTALISAKTTLRERWQEVSEEMVRTGAREMFLVTLDETITDNTLDTLYEANIQVITTKRNKEEKYNNNPRVLTFEKLIRICLDNADEWTESEYTDDQLDNIIESLRNQANDCYNHKVLKKAIEARIDTYLKFQEDKKQ